MNSVCAVIVTYNPNSERLHSVIDKLSAQLDGIVVVDNASKAPLAIMWPGNSGLKFSMLLQLESNIGLAAGQNRGVEVALKEGFSHVLMLDQDSIPFPGMVEELLATESSLLKSGIKPAVVGPQCVDSRVGGVLPFCQISMWGVNKINDANAVGGKHCCRADFLISSGSLIEASAYRKVGPFCEKLFIDNVDLEWCYRAASMGLYCFGSFDARLDHRLGDRVKPILGGIMSLHLHDSGRLFYIMRNRIMLYKKKHVPLAWKLNDFPRMIAKFVLFSLLVEPRWNNFKAMVRGCYRGIITENVVNELQ